MGPLLRRLLNLEDTMEFGLKKAKLFLVFVAICATTTATPIPTTNANGASMSAFLTNLKQGLENLLGMVQRFEMEQSTQIDQTTPKILVVGGDDTKMKTEMWPGSKTQCDLPDFPIEIIGAVGFNTAKGLVICGGEGEKRCFILTPQNQWMPFPNMSTVRCLASATEVNNDETLIIGGYDENYNALKTTELISSGGSVKRKDFPTTIVGHCSFKINSTHALVTGGHQDGSNSASTWFVDLTTTTVTPGPEMTSKRIDHSCSTFNLGRKTFGIVSGGYHNGYLDSTEWIDLKEDSPTWTEGPKLPRGLTGLTLVGATQGTYALGGYDGSNRRSEVLHLDCPGDQIQSCQWQEMSEKLEVGRSSHVSLSLPESYDICD